MQTITIEIQDAEQVGHDLSDLLCWRQGFETGMRREDEYFDSVAKNGIEAARKLRLQMKDKLK